MSASLVAIVSPMREVHRRLGGDMQDEITISSFWIYIPTTYLRLQEKP